MGSITTAGSGNWSSTTADAPWPGGTVPIEGDNVTIANGHTVTIDQNITIGNDTTTAAITINSGGKLQVLSTVAGSYTLTCKGDFVVNGTLEIGTVANPLVNQTFTILLNYSATLSAGKFGMKIGNSSAATVTIQGKSKSYYATKLAADASLGATSLTTAVSTGWKDNDVLGLAPTSSTYTECETITMNGDSSGTTINFDSPASLAAAHSGTSPTQAELVNLTRNIKITSYNAGYNGYISVKNSGTVIDWDWAEFSELGSNGAAKYGVDFNTNALSTAAAIRYCSFYNCYSVRNSIASNKLDIQDTVIYNPDSVGVYIYSPLTASTLSNIYIIKSTSSGYGLYLLDPVGGTISNIYISGCGSSPLVFAQDNWSGYATPTNIEIHSCYGKGIQLNSAYNLTLDTVKVWRCNDYGVSISGSGHIIKDVTLFGNTLYNLYITSGSDIRITGGTINSDSSYTTDYGVSIGGSSNELYIENVTFGGTAGHAKGDVFNGNSTNNNKVTLVKCTLSSTVPVYQHYTQLSGGWIRLHDLGGTEGSHYVYKREGIIESDATVYKTAAPSEKLTPYYATEKLESNSKYFTCAEGATKTIKVWVRKSAAYDGDEPRLILKRKYAAGVTSDAVLDTMTETVETWEQLSGVCTAPSEDTVYEVVVDCADGTAAGHYINVDDWTVE